jgi:hypothetical protein
MGAYESSKSYSLNETSATLISDINCQNNGWTNYYNTTGEKILVSIKAGFNDLGTITASGNLRTGYATDNTEMMTAPFGTTDNLYPFNRSWTITTSKTPVDSVGVRFYFGAADSSDVKNTVSFETLRNLVLYKVNGADAWNTDATGYTSYKFADTASKTTFTLGTYQGLQYAEFYITSFSSGSMAAITSSPLPLDLLNFSGRLINDKSRLEWLTANEENVSHFEVERSTGNNEWVSIGQVPARNIAGNQSYTFWDIQPANGWNYYRLKMVDIDRRFKYSKMIAVRKNGPTLLVYPNPNKGQFVVQIDNAASRSTLQLYDASGKLVHQQLLVQGINTINVQKLSGGVYILKAEDGAQHYIERMIIRK